MNQAIAKVDSAAIVRKVALSGNLKQLNENERWEYYEAYCQHLGLEPTTRPFDIMEREGKVSLYPNANCAAQLGERMNLSFPEYRAEVMGEVFIYRVLARAQDGREAWGTGAVPLGKSPLEIASAIKKAETQAKRRVTLSMGGLGITDSDEMVTIGAQVIDAEATQPEPEKKRKAKALLPAEAAPPPVQIIPRAETDAATTQAAQEESAKFMAEQKAKEDEEARIAAAKKTASDWMKKLSVKPEDQKLIWSRLDGQLDLIEAFLTIYPRQVPVVTSCGLCIDSFIASDYDAEKALSDIAHKGKQVAAEIAGAVTHEPPPALPNGYVEICQTYEIALPERRIILNAFNGSVQDAEDFLMFRTSNDVPSDFPLDSLIRIWKYTDGHLRRAKQEVAVIKASKIETANKTAPAGITPASRSLKDDPVGFDVAPFLEMD